MKPYTCLLAFTLWLLLSGCAIHSVRTEASGVRLRLHASEAQTVLFHCSLDGYRARKALRVGPNTWEVIAPGGREFRYFYVVDGRLLTPPCRLREQDDFGNENCLYVPGL